MKTEFTVYGIAGRDLFQLWQPVTVPTGPANRAALADTSAEKSIWSVTLPPDPTLLEADLSQQQHKLEQIAAALDWAEDGLKKMLAVEPLESTPWQLPQAIQAEAIFSLTDAIAGVARLDIESTALLDPFFQLLAEVAQLQQQNSPFAGEVATGWKETLTGHIERLQQNFDLANTPPFEPEAAPGALPLLAGWSEILAEYAGLLERAAQLAAGVLYVETYQGEHLLAYTRLTPTGDLNTVSTSPKNNAHLQVVRLVLTYARVVQRFCAVLSSGAAALVNRFKMPEHPLLFMPTVWRYFQAILAQADTLADLQVRLEVTVNPYVGPRTYRREEGHLFFGRDWEADTLTSLVVSERLVIFYAQSGAGKSSLINTRLIAGLEAKGFEVLPVGRVGGEAPPFAVDNILLYNLMVSLDRQDQNPERLAQLSLPDFLNNLNLTPEGKYFYDDRPVEAETLPEAAGETAESWPRCLIIDQFEEIFITNREAWKQRPNFFEQLQSALDEDPYLWLVLSLREDHIAGLEPYASLLNNKMQTRFYMQRMGYQAALEAIKQPAVKGGRPFAPDVAEALVNNLRQIRRSDQTEPVFDQFIQPVQLQVACYQLWQNLRQRPKGEITHQDLAELGDVDKSLAQFYEQALARILHDSTVTVTEAALRNWFGHELITRAGTRGLVFQDEENTGSLPNHVVSLLEKQFLIRAEMRAGGRWYELIHDRLVEPILNANRAWQPPQIERFELEPGVVLAGRQSVTLSWTVQNADQVFIEPDELVLPPIGQVRLSPTETTTYHLRAIRQTDGSTARSQPRCIIVTHIDLPHLSGAANPYVGPRTFQEGESGLFFGRDEEAGELLLLILSNSLVLLNGQSGAGKSSLINARLVPYLRQQQFEVLSIGRVSGELPLELTEVANIFTFNLLLSLDTGQYYSLDQLAGLTLTDYLARYQAQLAPDNGQPPVIALIIDQFEEIFTTHLDRWPERTAFLQQLAAAEANIPGLKVVISLREDYFGVLDRYSEIFAHKLQARFNLSRLNHQMAGQAVSQPAQLAGRPFAPGVAEALVDNLRRMQVDQLVTGLGEFVEPVQLQVVCYQLWANLVNREPDLSGVQRASGFEITLADLQQFGDADRALIDFYEWALRETIAQTSLSERLLRNWFDTRLITPARTRGLAYRGQIETEGLPNQAVDLLHEQFIIRADSRGGGVWYELVHDRFIEPILEANRWWQTAYHNPIAAAHASWEAAGRKQESLLLGMHLKEALAFAKTNPAEVTAGEKIFLEESQRREHEIQEQANQALRRRNIAIVVALTVMGVLAVLTGWALQQRSAAVTAAEAAQQNANAAATSKVVAEINAEIAATRAAEAEKARAAAEQALANQAATIESRLATPTFTPEFGTVTTRMTATPTPNPTATAQVLATQLAQIRATQTALAPTPAATPTPTPTSLLLGKIAVPVFNSQTDTYDLYIVSGPTWQLPSQPFQQAASQPAFSPDGTQIVFRSWGGEQLTSFGERLIIRNIIGPGNRVVTNRLEDARPDWRNFDFPIVFHSHPADIRSKVYLQSLWDSAPEDPNSRRELGDGENPTWLPDGRIVYFSTESSGNGLYVMNSDGNNRRLIWSSDKPVAPIGDPNSMRVVFSNDDDLYLLTVTKSESQPEPLLITPGTRERLPVWSPDGQFIAYVKGQQDNKWAIYVVRSDGTGDTKLFDLPGSIDGKPFNVPSSISFGWFEERLSWAP